MLKFTADVAVMPAPFIATWKIGRKNLHVWTHAVPQSGFSVLFLYLNKGKKQTD